VHGQAALPASPETVAAFLAAEARSELAINTLRLRHAAIRYMHLLAGYSPPTAAPVFSTTLAGIKRTHRRTLRKKAALVLEPLRAAVAGMSDTLPGLRDRALLLVGFGAALRPSEIARLRLDHLTRHADGLELFLPWRKNDQDARGTRLWLPKGRTDLCPVMALEHWLAASAITEGPLFRRIWRLPPPRRRKGTRGKPIADRYPASWIAIGMRRRASPYRRRCVGPIGSCAPGAPGGRLINWPARPRIFECAGGGRQHSVTAGTVFHRTSTPLRKWFGAAC
jgi:integrase